MIPTKSHWPFHGILVGLAGELDKVPEKHRKIATVKTVERCIRLGVKLAMHYGVSPAHVIDLALSQLRAEGGDQYVAVIVAAFDSYAAARIAEFKESADYVAHVEMQTAMAGVNGKGGSA